MTEDKVTQVTSDSPNGFAEVEREIARACRDAGRERSSVTLVAV